MTSTPRVVRFGTFELDLRTGELRRKGIKVHLRDAMEWQNTGSA